jgi:hypothetical protein
VLVLSQLGSFTPTLAATLTSDTLVLTSPLQLDRTSVAVGQTVRGSVTYQNIGSTSLTLQDLVITARPPGGTNLGGPYLDFTPSQGVVTVPAGGSITLTASRTIQASDPLGTWYTFSTYQDTAGDWHDASASLNLSFSTTSASLTTPTATVTPPTDTPTPLPTATSTPLSASSSPSATPTAGGSRYYVSKAGSNADGRSWATAWNELNQIQWASLRPGDTVLLDGGLTSMTYTTTLTVGKSGTASAPITLKVASEPGHTGQVIIFGGRSTPLPACGQTSYTYQTSGVRATGIEIGANAWLVIDGGTWRGLTITGHNGRGIRLDGAAHDITVRNVEISDNGTAVLSGGTWRPDQEGVTLAGTNITFERVIVHDNGQDAFQDWDRGVNNFTLRQSWLYNQRPHPTQAGLSSNYCTHTDGIQIWGGGTQAGVLVEDSILGPGHSNSLILGDPGTGAVVNQVTVRHVLFLNADSNHVIGGGDTWRVQNWTIQNVTNYLTPLDAQGGGHCSIELAGTGHTIRDSIFYHGCIYLPDGNVTASGNCWWQTSDTIAGVNADPKFVGPLPTTNTPTFNQVATADYRLQVGSPCGGKGSRITSVAQLLSLP